MARHFRELLVWQKAMQLAEAAYRVVTLVPDIERFGLSQQLRRSAVSVASNLAEGYERRSRADYRRFLSIACGSLAELETQLELCQRLHGIEGAQIRGAQHLADQTGRLLRAIERSLRVEPATAPPQPSSLTPQPS